MSMRSALHARLGRAYRRWALSRRVTEPEEIALRAWRMIRRQQYCLVVTEGTDGPSARVLEPPPPGPGGEISFGTDPHSRKVEQILRTGRCLLVYQDDRRRACVSLECEARLADPSAPVRFRRFWLAFWPEGPRRDFVNVVCRPTAMEVWDGLAVIAPGDFGRRSARLERLPDGPWRLADPERTPSPG